MKMLYDIVTGFSAVELVDRVRRMLQHGWTPIGGMTAALDQGRSVYGQAMVKHEL